jgi:hypothetical protein
MGISNVSNGLRSGVCTSTTRPATPYEGQMIYETDTDKMLVWTGSAWLYTTPPQTTEPGAWTTFTPTFKFGTTAAATSSIYGFYTIIGKLLILQAGFVSSGSQGSGSWTFTFPSPLEINEGRTYQRVGVVYVYDASPAVQYSGIPYVSANDGTIVAAFSQSNSGTALSNTSPMTWAVNDELDLHITARIL